ncbi:MAG: 16S rRNA (cytosine(967)-C(5))-methyltransferase RsmB [Desulfobacterales bacterium]|uniref:16S rRNA (cytosine(967)-C(5))-methyltransferase n=1 Tax=Candidatus Desulfatibia profunda TaxID=2841695 RepID=A0A8J6NU55_9BACT|nr:16S rRNA (cytosine(967)-C(5))-methyltransferase RsmB [Candidatus Desulfatibia profunda]MBL7178919.1 16S rRNA (cytosine(967)-C(5))-methyltransferase RsmB [Desulfobacterales bacterium]
MADAARNTALLILNTLDKKHQTLDKVLDDVLGKATRLTRKDRTLLNALVYGVLRWRGRLDWIIGHFSKTPLDRIDPMVLNILRLGLFQIMHLNRIPVSAAVNTSVEMAKSVAAPWVVRYVNGLLRNAAGNYHHVPYPDMEKDPVSALAVEKSFSTWLLKRWLDRFGLVETERLCDAVNTIPPITVRTNTLKTTRAALMGSLQGIVEKIVPTHYAPDGVSFFNPVSPVPEMESFKNGFFQVQDEAAQLVTLLLNPQPGETVLDACAGLGGKTGHIAQMMKNRGRLTALDNDEQKLLRLASEMSRLGISIVAPHIHDLNEPLNPKRLGTYDRILLDAPCSGLGVLRRNPDAKWKLSEPNLAQYHERQIRFLDNMANLVKPSGVLVYAVCSTEPEENDAVIKAFLNKHKKFVIENYPTGLPLETRLLVDTSGYLITFPHLNNMDGFFTACLKRIK